MNKKPFYVMLGYVKCGRSKYVRKRKGKKKESEYPMKFRRR